MATDLSTPSNTTAKMRWKEPYVSEGLNKKFNGVVSHGVVRGGRLGTSGVAMSVTLEADPNTNDSIYSFIDSNGHQITFRQAANVTLDLTAVASTTVYIGLEITFTTSSDTVVKWRAFSLAEIQADPTLVVLGRVDVPASGLIASSDIYPEERREAWMSISPGSNKWRQVITGGSFEDCRDIAATSNGEQWPDWDLINSNWLNVNLSVTDSEARTGRHSLHVNLTGSATQTVSLYWAGMAKVFAGQLIRASVRVKGSSLSPGPSGGECGIILRFWSQTGSIPVDVLVSDDSLSGTFDWTEISFVGEIPSGVASLQVIVRYEDGNSSTGDIYFDDVRVWLERGDPLDEYPGENRDEHYSASTRSLTIDIPREVQNLATLTEEMIRMRQKSPISSVLQLLMGARDLSTEFLMTLQKGGLSIDNLIESIGSNKVATPADVALPRIGIGVSAVASGKYTCIFEGDVTTYPNLRIYGSAASVILSPSPTLSVTINAAWNGTQWTRDDASRDSIRYEFDSGSLKVYQRDHAKADTWNDSDWETNFLANAQIYTGGNAADEFGQMFLYDGTVQFTGTLTSRTYPAAKDYLANILYAKSLVKAFAWVQTDGVGGATVKENSSLNIDTDTGLSFSGSNVIVPFKVSFSSLFDYTQAGCAQDGQFVTRASGSTGSQIELSLYHWSTGQVNLVTSSENIFFIVFGTQ
jgi:hypothetical protein